jgi:hypothetical protein
MVLRLGLLLFLRVSDHNIATDTTLASAVDWLSRDLGFWMKWQ